MYNLIWFTECQYNYNRILESSNKKRIEIKRMNKMTLKSEYIIIFRDRQVTLL